jgi:hypothetical protein
VYLALSSYYIQHILYFIDPNGHKLEIHASDWETRIKTAKANPWAEFEFFLEIYLHYTPGSAI